MQLTAFCILLLAISEPLLSHAKKVVVVFPRQIRRSPIAPWRSAPVHYKKVPRGSNEGPPHVYHNHQPQHYVRRPIYRNPPFPHGGDDFDQGHENVNHVHVPYGKEISHAITMGKGYIPYDNIRGSFSFAPERYVEAHSHKHPEPDFAPSSFSPSPPEITFPMRHMYENPHSEIHFSDPGNPMNYQERRNDQKKFYIPRSIEKELGVKTHMDLNSAIERDKEQLQKGTEMLTHTNEMQGAVILPAGIPPATIAGNREGIVLRDIVALDEYHKKLQELTKSWPQFLTGGVLDPTAGVQQTEQQQQVYATARFPTAGSPGTSFTGSTGWLSEFAQPKQGYAVKEELMEPQHDFRSVPVQTTPFQNLPLNMNVAVTTPVQMVHG